MAQRKAPEEGSAAYVVQPAAPHNSRLPVVMWINEAAVCVEIIDPPASHPRDGMCRCTACHGADAADWAADFL